jgi:mannosyltransferase
MLALGGITLIGAALRFATLDLQSFWNDEVFSAWYVARPFHEMLHGVRTTESNPPGYYVAAWLWAKVFGTGEVGIRSLSALAGTFLIPTTYATAATLVSRRAGLLAAALAATSPILVWYSQEARSYSLMVLVSGVAMLFFARAVRRWRTIDLLGWAVCSSLAVGVHYFAVFPAIAEAAALLVLTRRRWAVVGASAAIAAWTALLIPLVRQQSEHGGWIHHIPIGVRLEEIMRQLITAAPASPWAGAGRGGAGTRELWWLALLVLVGALLAAIRLGTPRTRRGVALSFSIAATTILVPLAAGELGQSLVGKGDYLLERNVLCAWLPVAVVVAAGFGAPRMGRVGLGAIAVLCAAGLAVVLLIDARPTLQRDDWRLVVRRLPSGTDAVLAVPAYQAQPLRYYDRALEPPRAPVRIEDAVVVSQAGVAGELPDRFTVVSSERVGRWELRRVRSKTPVVVPPVAGLLVRAGSGR